MEHPSSPELIRSTSTLTQENATILKTLRALNGLSHSENVRRALALFEFINNAYAEGRAVVAGVDDEKQDILPFRHTDEIQDGVLLTVNMNVPTYTVLLKYELEEEMDPSATINSAVTQYAQIYEHTLKDNPIFEIDIENGTVYAIKLFGTL